MDNLTHSLFGVALAEGAYQLVRRKAKDPSKIKRHSFYWVSIGANNFPDLDIIYRFFDDSSLGYLLTHRGHTHTLLWAIPQALLVLLLAFAFGKWGKSDWSHHQKISLSALAVLGMCVHMLLDFQNSYGIHFFSPFDNHWLYGDTLFIIEPLLWGPLMALAILTTPYRLLQLSLLFAFGMAQYLGFATGMATQLSLLYVVGFALLSWLVLWRSPQRLRPWYSLAACIAVVGLFAVNGRIAYHDLTKRFEALQISGVQTFVLSPIPSHPLCWTFFSIEKVENSYAVHAGTYQIGQKEDGNNCPRWMRGEALGLPATLQHPTPGIVWLGEYKTLVKDLFSDRENDCRIEAWFQFARVPHRSQGILTDLRFGGRQRNNFSTLDLSQNTNCPRIKTNWTPPRQDLLEGSTR